MAVRGALSPNDALWLNMDTPENLMVIESVLWFDHPLDPDAVVRVLGERLVDRYPIFTWRPESSDTMLGLDHWVDDELFAMARHVHVHDLGGAGGRVELQEFLEEQMAIALPRDRPLWQAHIVQGIGFGALVMRFHHAIADGTALARVLIELTTDEPDEPPRTTGPMAGGGEGWALPVGPPVRSERTPLQRDARALTDRIGHSVVRLATLPLAAGVALTSRAAGVLRTLGAERVAGLAGRVADTALGTADAVDKLVVGTPPDVLFFGVPGRVKRADWAPALDLQEVKRVARAHGATVNDVMLAAVSGALRRYQLGRGEVPQDVVTMIPVNLRPPDQPLPPHLGNKFALVAVELPLADPTPRARLAAAKERMDVVKAGPEPLLTFGLSHAIGAMGAISGLASRLLIEFFSNKAIGVTTNVPGPLGSRFLAGEELVGLLGWVPGAARQAIGVSIISYNGQIRVGFKTDAHVVPDTANLVAAYLEEMADLMAEIPE